MASLCPFIPSIDEDKPFLIREIFKCFVYGLAQPILIVLRGAIQEYCSAVIGTRSVIPAWENTSKHIFFLVGPINIRLSNFAISHNSAPKWSVECELIADIVSSYVMGRKFYAAIETELSIIFVSVGQCCANMYSFDAHALTIFSPYPGSPLWMRQLLRPIHYKKGAPSSLIYRWSEKKGIKSLMKFKSSSGK